MRTELGVRGGAAIEFGVVFPILMLLTTGTADLGHEMLMQMAVNDAAQAGAAYILMHPADVVTGGAGAAAAMTNATGLTISATPAPTIVNGVLTLTASASYRPILPWSVAPASLRSVITIRME